MSCGEEKRLNRPHDAPEPSVLCPCGCGEMTASFEDLHNDALFPQLSLAPARHRYQDKDEFFRCAPDGILFQ